MKRVLLISYPFPPVGGAGVQRVTKFVKYLPGHGWMPTVLTVANPSVPARDDSLLHDVPPEVQVHRARTFEPSYAVKSQAIGAGSTGKPAGKPTGGIKSFVKRGIARTARLALQPDPQVLWAPAAARTGLHLLKKTPHDAILVSGPPFSSFLTGAFLSRKTGVPLVLDYRDEWDISNAHWENKQTGRVSLKIQSAMQHWAVRSARALVATTRHSAAALEAVRDRAGGRGPVAWIYNGYDPDDFDGVVPPRDRPADLYRLSYIGTLWNLTDVAPLVTAVERLCAQAPALAAKLELVFAGRRTPDQAAVVDRLKSLPCKLVEYPYVDHDRALELVKGSDGLCALLSDVAGAPRVVPAKIFEYLACRLPVFAIGPDGEMTDILQKYPLAVCKNPADIDGITASLAAEIRRIGEGRPNSMPEYDPSEFDRRSQAGQLATVLDQTANSVSDDPVAAVNEEKLTTDGHR